MTNQYRDDGFTFKSFFVAHDHSPMKVTTDSVVLGAWAPLFGYEKRILDIGTGCGLLALMLAQRTSNFAYPVDITGVEVNESGAMQALKNMQASSWSQRLHLVHNDIIDFTKKNMGKYDLIITNPPYFEPGSACRDLSRDVGRYTKLLTHEVLLDCSSYLLTEHGKLVGILPVDIANNFFNIAYLKGWYIGQRLLIRHNVSRPYRLICFELAKDNIQIIQSKLTLRQHNGFYSRAFKELAKDFQRFKE